VFGARRTFANAGETVNGAKGLFRRLMADKVFAPGFLWAHRRR